MRVMYSILTFLYKNEVNCKLIALTQKEIQKYLEEEGQKYSDRTMYVKCKELLDNGYIKEGMKQKNARAFYISAQGIKWLNDVQKAEENE